MTPTDLQAAGFERYDVNHWERDTKSALYQKKVRADDGACLFFVNVYEMRVELLPEHARENNRWSVAAQFYRDGLTMDLGLHHGHGMTPADVEWFYRDAHAALKCTRDPHND
ncbi:MAG: hypothetical protein FJ034_08095 [Chloroflexi bacterium]|nr:hypothetical protein [Chloroflexota bacterium]